MSVSDRTSSNLVLESWTYNSSQPASPQNPSTQQPSRPSTPFRKLAIPFRERFAIAPLKPLRQWLDNVKVSTPNQAHTICKRIPSQCPFERDVTLFGRTLFHIPPLCKLNPLYDELVGLRFRALCYLADECGEDISQYC
ncbi:MAG: nitrogenase [Leptolyngbyaceae cyanobacterium SM1_3_5]|nr:nitrogenase [Leptolyngbyaceae cyanobacterium SM1_3_5]